MPLLTFRGWSLPSASILSLLVFLFWGSHCHADAGKVSDSTNFQNSPVNSVLDLYEALTDKHLIRDESLSGVPPISINAAGIGKADMVKLIEATLLLNGVAIVPVDARNSKVIAVLGGNKNPRSEGIQVYANAVDLPLNDQVVSYYMPLSYISAQEAQGVFTQNAPVHPYGAYVVAPSAQAVILTETTSVIRQLISLKELIDVPSAHVVSEFVQLNRADAEKTADLLNKMLEAKNSGGATGVAGNTGGSMEVPAAVGNDHPLLNEHSSRYPIQPAFNHFPSGQPAISQRNHRPIGPAGRIYGSDPPSAQVRLGAGHSSGFGGCLGARQRGGGSG
jgi:type II secretory pathway component GspD/PulD (secretin)